MGFPVKTDSGETVYVEKVSDGTEKDVLVDAAGNEYATTEQLGVVTLTAAAPVAEAVEPEEPVSSDLPEGYEGTPAGEELPEGGWFTTTGPEPEAETTNADVEQVGGGDSDATELPDGSYGFDGSPVAETPQGGLAQPDPFVQGG